jgi:putative ABC transport system substrate-binding protein
VKRREFITLLGAAVGWPLTARAQQPAMPVIGHLRAGQRAASAQLDAAFHQGLGSMGFEERRNVTIDSRYTENQNDVLPALVADLVRRQVAVIYASGTAAALAAKAATTTIPIVFWVGGDPVQLGLVASLNRPGGNVTGVTLMTDDVLAKRLELLHRLVPEAMRVAVLSTPNSSTGAADLTAAAASLGLQIEFLYAGTRAEIDTAFAELMQRRAQALMLTPTPTLLFQSRRVQLALLAARHRIPVMYASRVNVEAGGLMSYAADRGYQARLVGAYTGRILKGERPADLPVLQPTKFELVINLKTAKALGLTVPPSLLATADEVIE